MENTRNVNTQPLVDSINSIDQMHFDLLRRQDENHLALLLKNSYLDCDTNRVIEFIENEN